MAQIKKQGLLNLLINYIGFGIGGMNYILLMPLYFATYEIGLIRLLISLANLWVSLARLGTHVTFIRFFEHFRTADRQHGGFVHWMYGLAAVGMLLVSIVYLGFHGFIYKYFVQKSALFVDEYYYTLIPFALLMLVFSMLESQASAIQRTVLSNFLREIALRLVFLLAIILFASNWLNLRAVVWLQILAYGGVSVCLGWDLHRSGQFSWKGSAFKLPSAQRSELTRFSLLMMLTAGAQQLIQNLDSIMLGAMAGLEDVGVYGVYLSIALLVALPERSLMRILFPVANEALLTGNWHRVNELYKKSALIQLCAGLWILGGIWINEPVLYHFLKAKAYQSNFGVFILLGMNYLINMGFGMNSYIILGTRYYHIETLLNVILLLMTVLLNYFLIQTYGAVGAAGATFISITLINMARWGYILWQFKLSPFSWRNALVAIWGSLLIFLFIQIPYHSPWYIELAFRSLFFTALYFSLILTLKVAPDLNQTAMQIRSRLLRVTKKRPK